MILTERSIRISLIDSLTNLIGTPELRKDSNFLIRKGLLEEFTSIKIRRGYKTI